MMWGFGDNLMGFGFGWLGLIFMMAWWILIIAGTVFFVRWLSGAVSQRDREKTALDILKERYAKGEIDQKEFEEKARDIKNF